MSTTLTREFTMAPAKRGKSEGMEKESERNTYNVTAEEFVVAWQESDTLDEVAEKLGMPKPIVSARAGKYRGDGIKLKKMKRGRPEARLDIEHLNALIDQMNRQKKK